MLDPNDIGPTSLDLKFDSLSKTTSPTAQSNNGQSTGNFFADVSRNLLGLLDTGLNVYQKVDQITGGSSSRTAAEKKADVAQGNITQQPVAFGLNQTQILWIAGGLGVVLLISITARRG